MLSPLTLALSPQGEREFMGNKKPYIGRSPAYDLTFRNFYDLVSHSCDISQVVRWFVLG
jgi:hypothetical protein